MHAAEEQLRAALDEVGSFAASFSHGGAIVAVKLAEILILWLCFFGAYSYITLMIPFVIN